MKTMYSEIKKYADVQQDKGERGAAAPLVMMGMKCMLTQFYIYLCRVMYSVCTYLYTVYRVFQLASSGFGEVNQTFR